jgi:threonine aldolase
MPLTPDERLLLRSQCTRIVPGFLLTKPADEFRAMGEWCEENAIEHDVYGQGPLIESFEARIAALLGKEAAIFMPSGVMAQLIALKLYSQRAGTTRIGLHPSSHLLGHEEQAFAALLGLECRPIGEYYRVLEARDLVPVCERLAALVVELPIREAGGQLPGWEDLEALKEAARQRGLPLHMDGARLWESTPFYGRSPDAIAVGFESVYVSMYKGVGGLAGAVLAGAPEWIAEARIWRRRMGGTLVHQSPMIVSAARRLDARLELMPLLYRRAVELARALNAVPGLKTLPEVPQTNMFHLYFASPAPAVEEERDRLAEEHKVWLVGGVKSAEVPGWSKAELTVGDQVLGLSDDELAPLFGQLVGGSPAP